MSADTGDLYDVHPVDKSVIGKRIGEIIECKYYDNSPYATLVEQGTDQLILEIQHTKTLELQNYPLMIELDGQATTAEIKGTQLIIKIKPDSQVIRYGWQNAPHLSLFNEVGYPVSPFEFVLSEKEVI